MARTTKTTPRVPRPGTPKGKLSAKLKAKLYRLWEKDRTAWRVVAMR